MKKESIKSYIQLICIIGLIIMLSLKVRMVDKLENDLSLKDQNLKAMNDSVRVSKNKIKELEYSKNVMVGGIDELKKYNKDLYDQLKNTKGKVSELTQYIAVLKHDKVKDIPTDLITYEEARYGLKWTLDTIYNKDNGRFLEGESIFDVIASDGTYTIKPRTTILHQDILKLKVTQGLRKKGDNIEVFVTSSYPNLKITELNSIIINPKDHIINDVVKTKPKRFGIGFQVGYGVSDTKLSPYFGAGVYYSIIQF